LVTLRAGHRRPSSGVLVSMASAYHTPPASMHVPAGGSTGPASFVAVQPSWMPSAVGPASAPIPELGAPAMSPAEPLSVEAMQQEADSIQAWLAQGEAGLRLQDPSLGSQYAGHLAAAAGAGVDESTSFYFTVQQRCQESQAELQELRAELSQSHAHWQGRVASLEGEHARLLQENSAHEEELAACRAVQRTIVVEREAFSGNRGQLDASIAGLRRELAEQTQQAQILSGRAAEIEWEASGQPSPADVGAQRDVLRLLQRSFAGLQPQLRASAAEREGLQRRVQTEQECAKAQALRQARWSEGGGAKTLAGLQTRLVDLRGAYESMALRCKELEAWFGDDRYELDFAEQDRQWSDSYAKCELELAHGGDETKHLRAELDCVKVQCARVVGEEARLQAAAAQDQQCLEQLRAQLHRSEARNAGLEAEAQFLGLTAHDGG